LILHREIERKNLDSEGKFKILIIDSGAGVLNDSVNAALTHIAGLNDYVFYVSSRYYREQENLRFIPENEMLADYVASMDLVIGRAGFNTISECIGMRTPMLLIGEAMNPEMTENITMLKKRHLGSFISLDTFERGLRDFLVSFLAQEFKLIEEEMKSHEMNTNGAEMIVDDILNMI
jgi:UDP-N-acetylglucosamine:LPS N-acetylglucosamine transferase